ncbi:MAG: PQQ-binding-like beta-propeller repeat protein [Bacteroidota bacterium]
MKNLIISLLLLVCLPLFIQAQKISEWREANRTGVSPETGLLTSWPADGPALLWCNLELSKGYASVSFGNNTIYTTGTVDSVDVLYALDMSGKLMWHTVIGRAWNESFPESRATPTVEGNYVYTSSGLGDVACIDGVTGKIIWSYKASELNKGTYGKWGIAESLLLDGNKLYFSPGGPETMTIALDKTTGNLLWKSASLNDKPAYVSPILIDFAGKKNIINVSLGHVFAVDAANGEILWTVAHIRPASYNAKWDLIKCVTPLYHDSMVYVTGGYNTGGMMIKIAVDGKGASVAWTDSVLDVHHGGVVLLNGFIYGSNWLNNSNGNWCCIEWKTGKKMWEEHWNCKGSIISAEGMLYIYDEKNGNVGLLKANPEKFDLVSSYQVKQGAAGPFWAHPVIHNGILYLRHNNALMAYDIKQK